MKEPVYLTPYLPLLLGMVLVFVAIQMARRYRVAGWQATLRETYIPVAMTILIFVPILVLEAFLGPFLYSNWGAVLMISASVALMGGAVYDRRHRKRATTLLQQVGEDPPRMIFVGILIGFWVLVLTPVLWFQMKNGNFYQFSQTVFTFSAILACQLSLRGGLQLRENGVLYGSLLVPWQDIAGYELDQALDTVTLELHRGSFWNPLGKLTLSVPFIQQDAVMEILRQRVSDTTKPTMALSSQSLA